MEFSKTLKDWLGTFWHILISPMPATFLEESKKADGKFVSALAWLILVSLFSYVLASLGDSFIGLAGIFYSIVIIPLMIVLGSSAAHFVVQRVSHNKEYYYDKFVYIFTAIFVLIEFILIPFYIFLPDRSAEYFQSILWAYQFVLLVIAIKGIAKIVYWRSVVTALATVFAAFIVLACAILFSMLGGVSRTLR